MAVKKMVNKIDPATIAETPELPPEKEAPANLFKALKDSLRLFRDEDRAYAYMEENGVCRVYRVPSPAFTKHVKAFAFAFNGRGIGQTVVSDMVDTLEALAMKEGSPCKVSLRFAQREKVSYLDLCNDAWQVILVTENGWEVITPTAPIFTRGSHMRALPMPEKCEDISPLWRFFNLPHDNERLMLRAWLLTALLGEGINPAIIFHGEQGSAKSTSTRLLRALIDPNRSELRALPHDERDLFIAAQANPVLAFDNMSGLSKGMSDALCRIITGGSYSNSQTAL